MGEQRKLKQARMRAVLPEPSLLARTDDNEVYTDTTPQNETSGDTV